MLYLALIKSLLEYFVQFWGPWFRDIVEEVQRRVTDTTWELLIMLQGKRLKELNLLSLSVETTKD